MKNKIKQIAILGVALSSLSACASNNGDSLSFIPPETMLLIQQDTHNAIQPQPISVASMLKRALGGDEAQEEKITAKHVPIPMLKPSQESAMETNALTLSFTQNQMQLNQAQIAEVLNYIGDTKHDLLMIYCGSVGDYHASPMAALQAVSRGTKIAQTLKEYARSLKVKYSPALAPNTISIQSITPISSTHFNATKATKGHSHAS